MKGAVLIIGSLYWDEEPIRVYWRNNFLKMDEGKQVSVPIRYGRISQTRKNTYTMVFSSDLIKNKQLGTGYLVPLRMDEISVEKQCNELIKAEKNNLKEPTRFNWDFFAVGRLENPKITREDALVLENLWSDKLKPRFNPDDYKTENEDTIIRKDGSLKIDWSEDFEGNDFLICTVIKPQLKTYPEPIRIAEKMIENNYFEYFCKNYNRGINTFEDEAIKSYLP